MSASSLEPLKTLAQWAWQERSRFTQPELDLIHSSLSPQWGLSCWVGGLFADSGISTSEWPKDCLRDFWTQQMRWESLWREYETVSRLFHDYNIPFIPLKGIWIASELCRQPAQRTFCDVDIWIPKQALLQASKAMKDAGFKEIRNLHNRLHFHYAFEKDNKPFGAVFEIHTQLAFRDFHNISSEEIWQNANGSMTAEDQLLYIFYHSAVHFFDRPVRLFDLVLVYKWALKNGFNPDSFIEKCTRWKCRKWILFSILVLEWLLGEVHLSHHFTPKEIAACQAVLSSLQNRLIGNPTHARSKERLALTDDTMMALQGLFHFKRVTGAICDKLGIS